MMKRLSGLALRGLAVALPIGLTLYFVYWSISSIEWLMHAAFRGLGLADWYVPGIGLLIFVATILGLGLIASLLVFQSLLALVEKIFDRIPLIKSVYSSIKDFMQFVAGQNRAHGEVVSLEIAGSRMLGIVTDTNIPPALRQLQSSESDIVGVFLPMSYQLGGYTIYVSRDKLTRVDMDAESAMRYIMTAGIGNSSTRQDKRD